MTTTTTTRKARQITAGTVINIYGGSQRVAVERVISKWGSVQVTDGIEWYGLSADETVEVLGHFNI